MEEINIALIGDEGVGKTALVNCYAFDTFQMQYTPSLINNWRCELDITHPNYQRNFPKLVLNINDLSGKPQHRAMRQITYKKTDIVILCYSLSDNGKSIANVEKYWI